MSQITNNDTMFKVQINEHFRYNSSVVYTAIIHDLTNSETHKVFFRYDTLKKMHKRLTQAKQPQNYKQSLPEFPKTHSVLIWNRTNSNPKLLADRKMQLQFYLNKLLNHPLTRGLKIVRQLIAKTQNNYFRKDSVSLTFQKRNSRQKTFKSQEKIKRTPHFIKLLQIK